MSVFIFEYMNSEKNVKKAERHLNNFNISGSSSKPDTDIQEVYPAREQVYTSPDNFPENPVNAE